MTKSFNIHLRIKTVISEYIPIAWRNKRVKRGLEVVFVWRIKKYMLRFPFSITLHPIFLLSLSSPSPAIRCPRSFVLLYSLPSHIRMTVKGMPTLAHNFLILLLNYGTQPLRHIFVWTNRIVILCPLIRHTIAISMLPTTTQRPTIYGIVNKFLMRHHQPIIITTIRQVDNRK